ncbi:MAG: autotransporter-associated beta strand repeat-containing protein, partial [Verrucomicrobia bacterium]|nr:autotransporter-associated beta strand repeat-containing protein [Verrucomicrobiota bacterium]
TSLFCMVLNNTLTAPETARKGTCHRRPSTRLCSLLSLCGFVMLGAPSAQAANRTWDGGGGDDNWATAANWDAAIATGDSLFFDGTTRLTPNNNTPANNDYNITFNSGAGAFALSGFAIDLISGGFVVNNSANAQAVNHAVRLLGDGTLTSNGGTLTIGGTLSESGTALKTLTVNGAGNVTISGNITADSGDLQLTKAGTGTLALGGANTYTGTTTVIAGTLLANNTTGSATGTGAVNVSANGTLGGTGTITPTGTNGITVNGMVVPGSGIGNLTLNMGSTSGSTLINSGAGFQYELGLAGTDIGSYGVSDLISIAGASASDFAFNGNNINVGGTGGIGFY